MGSDSKDEADLAARGTDLTASRPYERPVLVPVGNLHDLLAQGGTQNADPGGAGGPSCFTGAGLFADPADCG